MLDLEKNKHERQDASKLFVLINCIDDKVTATIEELKHMEHVLESKQIDGPYDIIVKVQSTSNEELKKTLHKIRQLNTIRHTLTLRSSDDGGILG
ncbi:MAG TPA: Lrp/AsnC ligand binding domain-containing protein [Candidatus Nitrosotenuis sp.]|nr:Lrp/AsnC ligand binding domain-containing protein [Candidatus Nitrosotenuis sp.]